MSQPTLSDVHVNVPLTTISIAWLQSQENFIADKVFPMLPVMKQQDRYYTYHRDAFFRNDVKKRAPGTESAGTGYTLDNSQTYSADVYGLHDDVPDQIRANSDSVLSPDIDATMLLMQQMMIQREQTWINNYFATSLWTGGSGGATDQSGVAASPGANQFLQWNLAGSTPIEDVRVQALSIAAKTGYKPNTLVLGPYVGNQLINNPEIVDRVKYTQLGFLDYALLAQAFGVERVLVPLATQNTAQEPLTPTLSGSTLTMSFMYGKSAFLCYSEKAPGLRKPSAGYTFGWKGYLGGTSNIAVSRFRMQHLKADRIEAEMAYDMKLISSDMGVFFNTAVA